MMPNILGDLLARLEKLEQIVVQLAKRVEHLEQRQRPERYQALANVQAALEEHT